MKLRMLGLSLCFAAGTWAQQTVPRVTYFSGWIQDAGGKPQSGMVGVTFSLYEEQHGGAALWSEVQNVALDEQGRYTVLLGAMKPEGLPLEMFANGKARWLGIEPQLPGVTEQSRILLVGVPYALKAADADTLGGLPASAFLQAANGQPATEKLVTAQADPVTPDAACTKITSDGTATANEVAKFTGACAIGPSAISESDGNVGIGTTTPSATLDVKGAATVRGVLSVTAKGAATAAAGSNSNPLDLLAASFNSGTSASVSQHFRWQAEPAGNNTATPSGTLSLLYAPGGGTPAETGLSVSSKGLLTFASGQTFPGTGTVTGVTAGTGITETGTAKAPVLSLNTSYTDGRYLQLSGGTLGGGISLPANGLAAGANQLALSGGNVGIGTATPGARLEVAGSLKISGAGSALIFPDGSTQSTAAISAPAGPGGNLQKIALLKWFTVSQNSRSVFPVGNMPQGIAFDGDSVWVTNYGDATITKLRASDGTSLTVSGVEANNPTGIAFDGVHIWVANTGSKVVFANNASDASIVSAYLSGNEPIGVIFDGDNVWSANYADGTVTKADSATFQVLGTFSVGAFPYALAFDGDNVWVTNSGSGSVTKLRDSDGAVLGTFNVGAQPQGIAFDGANMWVTSAAGNTITKLRASDGAVLGTFNVGTNPIGVAFDGSNMWVANYGSNNITEVRASDGAVLGTFKVGKGPVGVCFDGVNIWVTNQLDNTVSKL